MTFHPQRQREWTHDTKRKLSIIFKKYIYFEGLGGHHSPLYRVTNVCISLPQSIIGPACYAKQRRAVIWPVCSIVCLFPLSHVPCIAKISGWLPCCLRCSTVITVWYGLKKRLNLSTKSVSKGGVGSQGALKEPPAQTNWSLCPATLS